MGGGSPIVAQTEKQARALEAALPEHDVKAVIAMRCWHPFSDAAARALKVSHVTVARRVASLEAALQAPLFDRKSDGFVATARGRRVEALALAMEEAAQMIVDAILQTQRADRLVQFATREAHPLTLGETIDSLVAATWPTRSGESAKLAALRRVTRRAVIDRVLSLAADTTAAPEARAIAELELTRLKPVATRRMTAATTDAERAQWLSISGDIGRWLDRRELPKPTPALAAPPGDPFGMDPF